MRFEKKISINYFYRIILTTLILSLLQGCGSDSGWESASKEEGIDGLKREQLHTPEMSNIITSKYIGYKKESMKNRLRVKFNLPDSMAPEDWLDYLTQLSNEQAYEKSENDPLERKTRYNTLKYDTDQKRYIFTIHCYIC